MYAHGDSDPRLLRSWLVKHLIPARGHGLLSGQWGTGKTFVVFDLFAALVTQQPFLNHTIKRQCGMMLIAAEGGEEVRLRLDAVMRVKAGGMARAPVRWYETIPKKLLEKGGVEALIAMAQQADEALQQEFGLPLGLIVIDTVAASAGYRRAGDENDPAVGQAIMSTFQALAQATNCFVLGVDHFGKSLEAGTRGASMVMRLKRVLMETLAEHSVDLPISPDGPVVRMVDLELIRNIFYAGTSTEGTPEQRGRFRRQKFTRALDWAEDQQLIAIGEINEVTYIWLMQANEGDDE